MQYRFYFYVCVVMSYFMSTGASAEPFDVCPSKAFIVQSPGASPILYGVDLSLGSYTTLSPDMGTSKVNGAGFSIHDNYMYGWDYAARTLAQFGRDYQAKPLNVSGLIGQPFYVGDVSIVKNAWYGYRPGRGLYRIDLSEPLGDLVMEKIASHTFMGSPKLTDLAFHPFDGQIYAVDNDGYLMSIDPADGNTTVLTQVLNEQNEGFSFTFGAQYFDVNENLYLSNNSNGYIYRVTLDGEQSSAVFFTYGPSSNSNDGARCALAEIEISDAVDFGDAPDSYRSTLDSAGARHGLSSLYLGNLVDGESDSYTFPLNDDNSDASNDDDGISFPTGFELDNPALIIANVTGSGGYLNGWIDWDQDGKFEADEKIANGVPVDNGANSVAFEVPVWASVGDTWARFRISTFSDIGPTGGVSNGEVEDYEVTVTESGVTTRHYPSANSFTTFAYEDLFPTLGDFDMNDVLMNVRYTEYIKDNEVIRIKIEGQIAALGASYHNGFAIRLPNVSPNRVKGNSIALKLNGVTQNQEVLETNYSSAVMIASDDLWSMTERGEENCNYFRVENNCGTESRPFWSMTIPFQVPVAVTEMPEMPYDPFIFATPGAYRGSSVTDTTGPNPGRKFEVHLKNKAPSDAFEPGLFNKLDDDSQVQNDTFFQTAAGIPWALEIPIDWKHPKEGISLLEAYPQFFDYALDPTGQTNPDWYLESNANQELLYVD